MPIEPLPSFDIALPAKGSRRRQHAIHVYLRTAVLDGRLKAGNRVPASRALARAIGVARITVVAAYDMLVAEGYFVVRRGAGTFVANLRIAEDSPSVTDAEQTPRPAFSALARADIRPVYSSTQPLPALDFTIGAPEVRQLRFDLWNRSAAQAMRVYCRRGESYGEVRGSSNLRRAIAGHVSLSRAVAASEDTIVVTCGAQQAIAVLAQVFVDPGRTTVAIEDPGYPPAFEAFAAAGATVVNVPVDPEGIVVDQLPPDAKIVYVTPSHQFPLGMVMSARRRAALLDFAATHGAIVVEDDYDSEYRFCGRPLDALQTMDRQQRVFYVGTFSKSLFPGVRLGFVVAPHWAVDTLIAAKLRADLHTNLLAQEALANFIVEGHLLRHVRRMHRTYASRRGLLLSTLSKDFDPWLRAIPSEAGLHVAAMTAPGLSASGLAKAARARDVGIYAVQSATRVAFADSCVLFGFGKTDEQDINRGLARLHRLLSSGEMGVRRRHG